MLIVPTRRYKKQHVIGGSGIFDSLVRIFTAPVVKQLASSAAKEVGKAALDVGKTLAVDFGKKLTKPLRKRVEDIVTKYADNTSTKGGAIAIENLVKRLNGSGLKEIKI